jgi:hypothetical protein
MVTSNMQPSRLVIQIGSMLASESRGSAVRRLSELYSRALIAIPPGRRWLDQRQVLVEKGQGGRWSARPPACRPGDDRHTDGRFGPGGWPVVRAVQPALVAAGIAQHGCLAVAHHPARQPWSMPRRSPTVCDINRSWTMVAASWRGSLLTVTLALCANICLMIKLAPGR